MHIVSGSKDGARALHGCEEREPDRDPATGGGKTWDIMYVSIAKGLQGSRSDRLLRYKLEMGELHLHLGKCIEGVLNK